jgi:RNase adaptor protein for sRNA GlmZ degradation
VTGISGSGKSVALHALEDAGFYCVDNLPPELLRDFLRLEKQQKDRRVAIAVDVRSAGSLPHLLPLLAQLKDEGVAVHPIFLDATTTALVRRFSKPAHPLADRGAGPGDRPERRLLAACAGHDRARHQPATPRPSCAAGCSATWWARPGRRVVPNPHYVPELGR